MDPEIDDLLGDRVQAHFAHRYVQMYFFTCPHNSDSSHSALIKIAVTVKRVYQAYNKYRNIPICV